MTAVAERRTIPATVLVGFLGAGKTTLLNRLLASERERCIAVIVNDFSQITIDAALVRHATASLIELNNGCICCTLRDDLVQELRRLGTRDDIDGIVIESTGIGEPMPIAQAFHQDGLEGIVRLEEIVTVVDAAAFWSDFERSDIIEDADGIPVQAPLAPLLIDQLEFTNVVLLNKTDRADEDDVRRLEGFVANLNPEARVYRTTFADVSADDVLGTGLYAYSAGPESDDWEETWEFDGAGEADEYGFTSFTYLTKDAMDHARFMALFDDWPDEILRSKGCIRFADTPPAMISVVRDAMDVQVFDGSEEEGSIDAGWDETQIVFIGRGMRVQEMVDRLDACLT